LTICSTGIKALHLKNGDYKALYDLYGKGVINTLPLQAHPIPYCIMYTGGAYLAWRYLVLPGTKTLKMAYKNFIIR
jgi:hypothetical protein